MLIVYCDGCGNRIETPSRERESRREKYDENLDWIVIIKSDYFYDNLVFGKEESRNAQSVTSILDISYSKSTLQSMILPLFVSSCI